MAKPLQTLNIPSNTVELDLRQPTGEINDEHAAVLGKTFATIIVHDCPPAFVKAVFDELSKNEIRKLFNLPKRKKP